MLIAVIEDQPSITDYVRLILEEEGYTVAAWATEAGAATFVRGRNPAMVLLDLHLDMRDAGIRIVAALRAEPETAGVPVIITTAQERLTREQYARLRGQRCGWLAKPYTFGALLSAVAGALVGVVTEIPDPDG